MMKEIRIMMRTLYSIVLLLLLGATTLHAQPRFVPDVEILKAGEIPFQQPKRFVFGFTNKGNKPLKIVSAHPSCGCVDVSYTTTPIEPNGKGQVVMTYDAKMLGTFHKEVELLTNASDSPSYLMVEGVVASDIQDYGNDFPIDLGNVRLQTNYVEFDDVNKGDMPVAELKIVNTQRSAFRPELMHLPPYLTAQYLPADIAPGRVGTIRLILDSKKLKQMGLNQTSVYLARYLGDKVGESNEVQVSAVLLPDFSRLTEEQMQNAPVMSLSEKDIDFGSLAGKPKLSRKIIITNNGKTDLHIQQVQVFNKAVTVSVGNRVLKPGKSTKMTVSVLANYLHKAKGRPRVLIISDDPNHPKEVININIQP